MTIEECRKYLPASWVEIIEKDPVLLEIFHEHEYDLDCEAVPLLDSGLARRRAGASAPHLEPLWRSRPTYVSGLTGD